MKKIILSLHLITAHIAADSLYDQAQKLQKNESFQQAIQEYKKIISDAPYHLNALFNLGCCYLALGKIEKAIQTFESIVRLSPGAIPAHYNIAYTHKTAGNLDYAIHLYKQIIAIDNDYDPAHLALGFAYLTQGDFENGWKQHERYLKKSGKNGDALRTLLQNNTLAGKKILLRPEGGLGDSLQFIRYAQRLHDMGAYVIVGIQKSLIPLLSLCPYIDELISHDNARPHFDADATLMSLPAIFNDNEQTFPSSIPYLYAQEKLVKQWRPLLAKDTNYKIGICWQADVKNDASRLPIARRGCALKNFVLLHNIPGISFYSLQKYDGVEEITTIPSSFVLHHFNNLDAKTGPFEETAALMENLDLIITVDTAIAHLAGALGRKVWLLLPYATDWRWVNNRTDSPWYPTMKIFKQKTPFDWTSVIEEVYNELRILTQ